MILYWVDLEIIYEFLGYEQHLIPMSIVTIFRLLDTIVPLE